MENYHVCLSALTVHDHRYKSRHFGNRLHKFSMMDSTHSSTIEWNKTDNFPSEICILVQEGSSTCHHIATTMLKAGNYEGTALK